MANTIEPCDSMIFFCEPVLLEVMAFVFFFISFAFFRFNRAKQLPCSNSLSNPQERQDDFCRKIEDEVEAGRPDAAVAIWRVGKAKMATHSDTLELIAQALLHVDPKSLVNEIVEHLEAHRSELGNSAVAAAVLEAVATGGRVQAMEDLLDALQKRLNVAPTQRMLEAIVSGYALAGDVFKVRSCMDQARATGQKITQRAYSLSVKGVLKKGLLDEAMSFARDMQQYGFVVSPPVVTELCRVGAEMACTANVLDCMQENGIKPTSEALLLLCEHVAERSDIVLGRRVEQFARTFKVPLCLEASDALLRTYIRGAPGEACELYAQMLQEGLDPDPSMYAQLRHCAVQCGKNELVQGLSGKVPV